MNPKHVVRSLEKAGVLEPGPDDFFLISSQFEDTIEEKQSERGDDDSRSVESAVAELGLETERADTIARLAEINETVIAIYRALDEVTTELEPHELVDVLTVFDLFQHEADRTEGAPESFFPIQGDYLETFLELYRKAVIYVWREDCDPCDLMQEDLDEVLGDTRDVMTLAVYGPDIPLDVRDQYSIVGAPITLFVRDGHIDSRLVGAYHSEIIEAEADTLRELVDG